jgi:hypothetical protein
MVSDEPKNPYLDQHPNSDLENETLFPFCHCERLKGAWESDEVVARAKPVAISWVPSLCSGQGFVSLAMTIS